MDALMYDYRVSSGGAIGSTIIPIPGNPAGIPILHAAAASPSYGGNAPSVTATTGLLGSPASPSSARSTTTDGSLTQSLLSNGDRTEAKSGGTGSPEVKAWTAKYFGQPTVGTAYINADDIRKTKEKTDKEFLYSASAGMHHRLRFLLTTMIDYPSHH
jgi:hypothetical protein